MNEIWDGNKGPEDLTSEFSDFFKLSKRGYFLNDFDDSMKNHMYDSPLPPLTALNPIEKMPVKKDQRFLSFILNYLLKRFLVAITCNPYMWKISMKWSEESWRTSKFEWYIVYGPYHMICSYLSAETRTLKIQDGQDGQDIDFLTGNSCGRLIIWFCYSR